MKKRLAFVLIAFSLFSTISIMIFAENNEAVVFEYKLPKPRDTSEPTMIPNNILDPKDIET